VAPPIDETAPMHERGHPVRRIRARVIDGPDQGARALASSDSLSIGTAEGNDLRLSDPAVSRYHVELRRHLDRIAVVDHGSTNGTGVEGRLEGDVLSVASGARLRLGNTLIEVGDGDVVMELAGPKRLGELHAAAPMMSQLFATAKQVARSDVSVLLLGESGTGKELLARAIHESSPRKDEAFVTVDCGALSSTLFTSELFGHEKGAFTGADRAHAGAFERAHGGTLFIDEIGELGEEQQVALLGALERGRLRRVGGTEEIEVDVRVISATHRDLRAAVNQERFRLDLYYRVAVVALRVPPLRERPEDIPALIEHFLSLDHGIEDVRTVFSREALGSAQGHDWPGNVRELRNFVAGTVVLGAPPTPLSEAAPGTDVAAALLELPFRDAKARLVEDFERRYLERALQRADGNMRQAARDAKMNRSYLMELLRRHGFR